MYRRTHLSLDIIQAEYFKLIYIYPWYRFISFALVHTRQSQVQALTRHLKPLYSQPHCSITLPPFQPQVG